MATKRVSRREVSGVLFVTIALIPTIGYAGSLLSPREKPILTISGKIRTTNNGETAQFDRSMLEALGTVVIETTTPWYSGAVKFEGVELSKLMDYVGSYGQILVVTALNDYTTEIPISDFLRFSPILATKRNGQYMTVRDKGPLFIIYPFDSKPELKSQTYYGRSAWQVAKMVVK